MDPVSTEGATTFGELLKLVAKTKGAEAGFGDLPAKVIAYNAAQQTATVQPLVLVPRRDQLTTAAPCHDLQVRWPAGSTWSIVGDLVAGDFGWIRVAGADISAWRMQATELDPLALKRRNSLSDAVFEPGSQPVSVPLAADAYKAGALVIKAAELLLGDSTATKLVALAVDVVTELQFIRDTVDAHSHAGHGVVPTVLFTALTAVGSCAATKVKAI